MRKATFVLPQGDASQLPQTLRRDSFINQRNQFIGFGELDLNVWTMNRTAPVKIAVNEEKTELRIYKPTRKVGIYKVEKYRIVPFVGLSAATQVRPHF